MRFSRAVLISLGVTVALTAILTLFFGPRALGLFLFLPLSFAIGRQRRKETVPSGREPIEPH